ncbi:MAG: radical SAM family heme chaperone HemW [Melioribacteraceae bacterium]|nr:radical SAM family heme chaperone HemW [Melioribacteraceae bacterium]MDD3559710.1 radical SAM family heme chaperone HemW [Melioribacteraceae bacterium]
MKNLSIYIHIPFCDHKCIYCDFYSLISYENVDSYLKALKKEINYYSKLYSKDSRIISIFFGGGTPSYMEPGYISELIETIRSKFNLAEDAEITLETNPGTVSSEKLSKFKMSGVNRLSVGVQSFDENELKFLTRIHNAETAEKTILDAAEVGFENISLDLIFNLPKQTKVILKRNLEKATTLPIKHISAYSLILERGTILNKMVIDGKVEIQDSDYDADLYEFTIDYLMSKGFLQYEVSNFAFKGYECVHNNSYWRYINYLGLGTSSHSFIDGVRWWNVSSLKMYLEMINNKGFAKINQEILSLDEKINEYIMLALRSSGLDKVDFQNRFESDWLMKKNCELIKLKQNGFLHEDDKFIKFTGKGYALCDEILVNLL